MAAVAVHRPQIPGIRKDNQSTVKRRPLQQRMRSLSGGNDGTNCGKDDGKQRLDHFHLIGSETHTVSRNARANIIRPPA
jgi:hypothetical protein